METEFKTQSETVGKIAAALVAFQSQAKGVKKTAENPFFHSKYAELSDVWNEIREPLSKNGLAVVQTFLGDSLVTTLAHTSGEWFRGYLKLTPAKANDPQAQGSAITYVRRYALQAITGIAPIDDDGNAGSGKGTGEPKGPAKSNPTAPQKKISTAEANTLIAECKLRGITGRALLDEIQAHFPEAHKLADLPADAYEDAYEWILRQEMPKSDALEEETVIYEGLGIPRDTVLTYIASMPGKNSPEGLAKHLKTMREEYKPEGLRKMFADVAGRSKNAAA